MPFNEPIDLAEYDIDGAFDLYALQRSGRVLLWPGIQVSPGLFVRSLEPYIVEGDLNAMNIAQAVERVRQKADLTPMDKANGQSAWDDAAKLFGVESWRDLSQERPRATAAWFFRTPRRTFGYYQLVPVWDRRLGNGVAGAEGDGHHKLPAGTTDEDAFDTFTKFFHSLSPAEPDFDA